MLFQSVSEARLEEGCRLANRWLVFVDQHLATVSEDQRSNRRRSVLHHTRFGGCKRSDIPWPLSRPFFAKAFSAAVFALRVAPRTQTLNTGLPSRSSELLPKRERFGPPTSKGLRRGSLRSKETFTGKGFPGMRFQVALECSGLLLFFEGAVEYQLPGNELSGVWTPSLIVRGYS